MKEKALTKAQYWQDFDGSEALFNACWRQLKKEVYTGSMPEDEVSAWLEAFAAERVNNPKSRFYIYG